LARGLPMRYEAGGNLASRRDSHFGDRTILTRRRFLLPREIECRPPLAPLSPPPCRRLGSLFFESGRRFGGRQDRFCGGLVKGVRFADPGCLPPVDAGAHPAHAEARTKSRSLPRRRGAHVMRIAELRGSAPLLPPVGSCACAPERPPMVRLPFTRSYAATRLSTQSSQVARFSEPEGVLPTSAIRRCTGTDRELLRSSCCRER